MNKPLITTAIFLLLFSIAFLAGQTGIPVEDGGEFLTVARLGGTNHPPGLPLLSLSSRVSWILFGREGLCVLFALFAALALKLIKRKITVPIILFTAGILLLPFLTERLLAWDAYGPLFLIFAITLYRKPAIGLEAGYLMGLALAIHPQGIFLPVLFCWRKDSIPRFIGGLVLGCSLYLALPICSASGAIVDWGNPGSIANFLRQVTAGGYREVYGSSMGSLSINSIILHSGVLWKMLWPVLLIPAVIGTIRLFKENRELLLKLGILFIADLLFVLIVNPMAAGTSQTATLSLLVVIVLSIIGISAIEKWRRSAGLLAAGAVLAAGVICWNPLPDQSEDIIEYYAPAPLESIIFVSNNDLLYGGWVMKYVDDRRPDMVLLSTGNFSGWFERMATWFNPEVDLSRSVLEVGDYNMSREELANRLINATIQDNPNRSVFTP
ncbi:MAG: hypothetical protein KAW14_04010 [Candidatus Aegiribacteria sp.]|nr:hypothetical protein [Candidatus Aegiribacteria sp.]